MRKSKFINKVLKSRRNTVFTKKEQVENALKVFEAFGMLPPVVSGLTEVKQKGDYYYIQPWRWENENSKK